MNPSIGDVIEEEVVIEEDEPDAAERKMTEDIKKWEQKRKEKALKKKLLKEKEEKWQKTKKILKWTGVGLVSAVTGGLAGFFAIPALGAAIGCTVVGPVAGGALASAQAAGTVIAGGAWATAQSAVMGGAAALGITAAGGAAGAVVGGGTAVAAVAAAEGVASQLSKGKKSKKYKTVRSWRIKSGKCELYEEEVTDDETEHKSA